MNEHEASIKLIVHKKILSGILWQILPPYMMFYIYFVEYKCNSSIDKA